MSIFNEILINKPKSNTFNLSHDRKMSMQMGTLTPTLVMDVLPGDKIKLNSTQMLRFAPMIAPVMHRIDVFTHFFFVPNRLTWSNWEDFITGGEDGLDNSVFPYIKCDADTTKPGSLTDYLGIPILPGTGIQQSEVSALPFAAYSLIFNEYYRDQNLIAKRPYELVDGYQGASQSAKLQDLQYRAWQHDYFTSALPWTQKGPEATIPLGSKAPIMMETSGPAYISPQFVNDTPLDPINLAQNKSMSSTGDGYMVAGSPGTSDYATLDLKDSHFADLSTATASSINDLRQAFRLQEFLEKNARGGSRYIEVIKSHFGVTSSDARLQRPEYLGGGKSPVTISEVLQTSESGVASTDPTPQGNMAGHGINVGGSNNFSYYAQEHGYIIGIMSIMPKTAYFQGIPKHFKKFDKFDYYFPSFAHLGEQPITTEEIWATSSVKDDQVFGYTPRYAEYKHMLSSVHGEFRTTLEFWHMARKFDSQPYLNEEFINCDPTERIFAVQGTISEPVEQIYAHIFHDLKATRLMPYFGTPKGV
ncbi:MAG: major capsid protein [Microviridae sp.]|nr:MAG: major capsid protein [Microviridae sp.]